MQDTGQTVNNGQKLAGMAESGMQAELLSIIENAPAIKTEHEAATIYLRQFQGFTIADADGYRAAKAYASEIRTKRLEMDKRFSSATLALKTMTKGYEKQAGELLNGYKVAETAIRAEIQRVDDEKKAEKEKAEREAAQRFMERTDRLFENGYTFNGAHYTCGMLFLDSDKIQGMEDDEFAAMVEKGRVESERIAQILAASEVKDAVVDFLILPEAESRKIEVEIGFYSEPEQADPLTDLPKISELPQFSDLPDRATTTLTFYPKPFPEPDPNFRPPGFTAGFDACKKAVLEILGQERKFTRAELVGLISALKA